MASLDVESLFNNIPLEETTSVCCDSLFSNDAKVNNINRIDFQKLLRVSHLSRNWWILGFHWDCSNIKFEPHFEENFDYILDIFSWKRKMKTIKECKPVFQKFTYHFVLTQLLARLRSLHKQTNKTKTATTSNNKIESYKVLSYFLLWWKVLNSFELQFKDIIIPYNCLPKKVNFSIKTSNEYITS